LSWRGGPTGWSAALTPTWSSTTRRCPRRAAARSGWRPSTPRLGKNANCQTLVSLTLAKGEVEVGVSFGVVLADAGYGLSAPFRQGLSTRGLAWAVGIPRHQKVYPADVGLVFPVAGRGRPRKRHVPDRLSVAAEAVLAGTAWRTVSWRRGTKGRLTARFAAVRVRVADGPPQRIGDMGAQHMPGEEAWAVGERRRSGERKYYLSNLPADTQAERVESPWNGPGPSSQKDKAGTGARRPAMLQRAVRGSGESSPSRSVKCRLR
jgi:hypothetical protein